MDAIYNLPRLIRAAGSVVEHFLHTEGVTGSIPVPPTINSKGSGDFAGALFLGSIRGSWDPSDET